MPRRDPGYHLVRGPYGPYILTGQQNRLHTQAVKGRPKPAGAYSAWLVENGQATLLTPQGRRQLHPPVGVMLWPGDGPYLAIPPGSTWRRLSFDVVYQRRARRGGRAQTHAGTQAQPPPQEVWNAQPDQVIAEPLLATFRNMMLYCVSHWWRGDLEYARSNNRLGAWLLDWASAAASPSDPAADDPISRIERQAVNALDSGVTVSDMARMARVSRRHFHRVYRDARGESPGEFLRTQRLEKAVRLLRTTQYDIGGIAQLCGFKTVASFSHSFKAQTRLSPSAWRRANST